MKFEDSSQNLRARLRFTIQALGLVEAPALPQDDGPDVQRGPGRGPLARPFGDRVGDLQAVEGRVGVPIELIGARDADQRGTELSRRESGRAGPESLLV